MNDSPSKDPKKRLHPSKSPLQRKRTIVLIFETDQQSHLSPQHQTSPNFLPTNNSPSNQCEQTQPSFDPPLIHQTNISDLPTELLQHVFSFFYLCSQIRSSHLVCKQWHSALNSLPSFPLSPFDFDSPKSHLRANELHHRIYASDVLKRQSDVTGVMRAILVNWLSEVCQAFKLNPETLFLSVNYIDRFLAKTDVPSQALQCLGITCLWIASKFEESVIPGISQIEHVCAGAFNQKQILQMELDILRVLNFELAIATTRVFLDSYIKTLEAPYLFDFFAYYYAELTLTDEVFLKYFPSLTAAACLCLALHSAEMECWTVKLEHNTAYSLEDISMRNCVGEVYLAYKQNQVCVADELSSIKRKYSSDDFRNVASIPVRAPSFFL